MQTLIIIVFGALILYWPTLLIVPFVPSTSGWPVKAMVIIIAVVINLLWLEPTTHVTDNERISYDLLGWWAVAFAASYAFGWIINWFRHLPKAPHTPSELPQG